MTKKIKSIALLLALTFSPALKPMSWFWGASTSAQEQQALAQKLGDDLDDAIKQHHIDTIKRLFKEHVDVNKRCNGWLPLERAILHDSPKMVKLLIDNGANVNSRINVYTWPTLLSYTLMFLRRNPPFYNVLPIAKLLIEHGADINTQDCTGNGTLDLDFVAFGFMRNDDHFIDYNTNIFHYVFYNYLILASYYESMRKAGCTDHLLQYLNFEQRQDVLEIALTQNHGSDLEKLHDLNPKQHSWDYMLALAEQKDLYKPVAFLLAKLSVHPSRQIIKNAAEIMDDAKVNDKKNFGRAVRDFIIKKRQLQLNKISFEPVLEGGITDSMPNEIAYKIMEYME